MPGKKQQKGFSLRVYNFWMVVAAVIMTVLMVYSIYRLSASFLRMTRATESHIFDRSLQGQHRKYYARQRRSRLAPLPWPCPEKHLPQALSQVLNSASRFQSKAPSFWEDSSGIQRLSGIRGDIPEGYEGSQR